MQNDSLQTEQQQPPTDELKEIARQLAHPDGERGVDMGHMMNESNISMIRNAIRHLKLKDEELVLELGHGNANHLTELHQQASDLVYYGLDISATMNSEAEDYAKENNLMSKSSFTLYDGTDIPFTKNTFDKIFTVNTIYFWQDPNQLLDELYRVLKDDGILCITFVDKGTMDMLPFTAYGFTKYTADSFEALIDKSQFKTISIERYAEKIKNKMLQEMERIYFVALMAKG